MQHFSKPSLPLTPALVWVLVANLLDGIFTLILIEFHGADEVNPLLAWAYRVSPLVFFVLKIGLVYGAIFLLAIVRGYETHKRQAVGTLAVLFMILIAYHGTIFLGLAR